MKHESLDPEPADAILVVEPDVELYSHMAAQIRSAGLSALSAKNAAEALSLLSQRADIALVFTAVNMPGLIDGVALAVRVHRERPDLAIVITSAVVNLRQSTLPRRCRFLRKPYEPEEAIKCFRFLLDLDPAISQGGSTVAD